MFERAAREFGRLRADGEVARPLDAPLLTRGTLVRLLTRAALSRGQTRRTPTDKGETRVRAVDRAKEGVALARSAFDRFRLARDLTSFELWQASDLADDVEVIGDYFK